MPGHLFGLRQTEEKQERGRDIGQNSVFAAKLCRVLRHINEMHKVGGVRRIWRSVWIAHLLAISVVGRDDAFAIKIEKFRNDACDAFVYRLNCLNAGIEDA